MKYYRFVTILLSISSFMLSASVHETKKSISTTNIAMIDVQQALLESEVAKKYTENSKKDFQPKLDQLAKERDNIKEREEHIHKQSLSMSKHELHKQKIEIEAEKQDFLNKLQNLRHTKEQADAKEMKRLEPLLQKAINKIAEKHNFDIILDKNSIVYQKNLQDLTKNVINTLNQITHTAKNTDKHKNK